MEWSWDLFSSSAELFSNGAKLSERDSKVMVALFSCFLRPLGRIALLDILVLVIGSTACFEEAVWTARISSAVAEGLSPAARVLVGRNSPMSAFGFVVLVGGKLVLFFWLVGLETKDASWSMLLPYALVLMLSLCPVSCLYPSFVLLYRGLVLRSICCPTATTSVSGSS